MRHLAISLFWAIGSAVAVLGVPTHGMQAQQLQAYARQYEYQLGIADQVSVYIVPVNERLASVRPSPERKHAFILEVDRKFLATLSDAEKRAMIAHEMGHVWIFTHFPYVQSEFLANQEAEQLVSEASLEKIYRKVWQVDGRPGTLDAYLDQKIGTHATQPVSSAIPALSGTADARASR